MKNSSRDYAKKNVSARTAQDMLRIASERLSTVRYVFIVHIESGIPSAASRAALEYADAVLIGWPDSDASDVVKPNHSEAEKPRMRSKAWKSIWAPSGRRKKETTLKR